MGAATISDERQEFEGDGRYNLDPPHEMGVYLLAIVRDGQHCRYWHARHYLGWAVDIADRVAAHRRGKGARFTQTLVGQGYDLWLVAWFPGDRTAERTIKLTHHTPRFCPVCRAGLCVIDQPPQQPPQHTCVRAPSRAQDDGKAAPGSRALTLGDVPDLAWSDQPFRQGQLLHLTASGTDGAGDDVTSAGDLLTGDTVVELLPSRSTGAI